MTALPVFDAGQSLLDLLQRVRNEGGRVLIDDGNGATAAVVPLDDLERLNRAEQSAWAARLFETGPVGMAFLSADGRCSAVNPALLDFLGLAESDLVGESLATALRGDEREFARARLSTALREGQDRSLGTLCFHHRSGRVLHGAVACLALSEAREDATRLLVLVQDVTAAIEARDAFERTNAFFRTSESLARLGHWEWDEREDRCSYCSEELARLHGTTVEDFIRRTGSTEDDLEWIHPDDRARYLNAVTTYVERRQGFEIEYRLRNDDGKELDVREVVEPVLDEGGRLVRSVGFVQDISERKRQEERSRQNEALLFQAAEMAGLGYWVWDEVSNRCVYCSQTLASLYHTTPERYIERFGTVEGAVSDMHADDRARYLDAVERAIERRESYDVEFRRGGPDGDYRHMRERGEPVLDHGGRLVRTVGTTQDITEHKLREMALQQARLESESWLKEFVRNVPDEVVMKDSGGHYLMINPAAERRYGQDNDDVRGKTARDLFPPEVAAQIMAHDALVLETGKADKRTIAIDVHGRPTVYEAIKVPIRDQAGQTIGLAGIGTDVTEARRSEEALRQAQKMEAVGRLTGGVAHDFNNILAVILGNAELMARDHGDSAELLQGIIRAGRRGAELSQRLLAYSRRQPLTPLAVDLGRLVEDLRSLMCRTLGETVEVEIRSEARLWPALVDAGQMETVLLNLAINARDAMPRGGRLEIETMNAELDDRIMAESLGVAQGDYVVLIVRDNGAGMSDDVLARAGEPFFTTKEVGQGTGLGLAMISGFAEQSGGHLKLYSEVGEGTTVMLYLPRAPEPAPLSEESERVEPPASRGERVLLVEDDPDVRSMTTAMLRDLGYAVLAEETADAALARLDEGTKIDLVLSDVVLPGGMSGNDLAQRIRGRDAGVRVLLMTGYVGEAVDPTGAVQTDSGLLRKPFTRDVLAERLRSVLEER